VKRVDKRSRKKNIIEKKKEKKIVDGIKINHPKNK
jgi:hypothetical protein